MCGTMEDMQPMAHDNCDVLIPVAAGDIRLLGRVGGQFAATLDARVFSEYAQGPVYDEAENAFATHWDDSDDHAGWQNEYWGKTMLCYAGAVRYTRDAKLAAWCVKKAHHLIDTYQHPDGYLSTYGNQDLLRKNPDSPNYEKHWCFNIWGQKYTMWALIELYRATGDKKCLKAAEKMMDQLISQMKRLNVTIDKTGSWAGISSMSILRPLIELYIEVPKPEYKALADHIVKVTDVREGNKPDVNLIYDALSDRPVVSWFRKPMFLSKAYELQSFFEGVAAYHRLTGDARTLASAEAFCEHPLREAPRERHDRALRRHSLDPPQPRALEADGRDEVPRPDRGGVLQRLPGGRHAGRRVGRAHHPLARHAPPDGTCADWHEAAPVLPRQHAPHVLRLGRHCGRCFKERRMGGELLF